MEDTGLAKWEDLHKNRKSRLNSFTVDREEKEKYINDQKERYRSLRGAMVRRFGAPDFLKVRDTGLVIERIR